VRRPVLDCYVDDADRIDRLIVLGAVLLGLLLTIAAGFPAGQLW
jgi:hypothetical protein